MRNRTPRYGITKVLALALALLLTLGNLPLVSFATETGGGVAAEPAAKKAADFKYQHHTHFYFATGKVGDNVLDYPGGSGKWWPVQGTDQEIFGTMVSDRLNLRNDADGYESQDTAPEDTMGLVIGKHYPARYQRFNDIQLSVKYQENGVTKETELFPATEAGFARPDVREAFAKYIESRPDKRVVTFDHETGEELVIIPDNMRSGEVIIHPMRYVKYVSNAQQDNEYRRIHVDLFLSRAHVQPITVEEYVDGASDPTISEIQGNLGTVLKLEKPDLIIDKIEVSVDGATTTIAPKEGATVADQLKEEPITHDTKPKTVKVWYRTLPSAGIEVVPHHISFFPLLPQQDENFEAKDRNIDQTLLEQYRFNDFIKYIAADGVEQVQTKVDAKKPGTVDKFKISAPTHPTQQIEIQKVSLLEDGKIIKDSIDSVKEVYTIEHKQGKKISLLVYYKIKTVRVDAYTLKDGKETRVGEFLVPMDADYSLAKILDAAKAPAEDKLRGISLNTADSALIEAKDLVNGNTIPKARIDNDITKIYLHYEGSAQHYKITIYEQLGDKELRKAEETGVIGKDHRIKYRNKMLKNYDFDGIYVDGEKITNAERVFPVTKAEHKVVFKYIPKVQTSDSDIVVYEQIGDGAEHRKVVEKAAMNQVYTIKHLKKANYDLVGIFVDGELQPKIVNKNGVLEDVREFKVTKATHKVVFRYEAKPKLQSSKIGIYELINGKEVAKGYEESVIGQEFVIKHAIKPSLKFEGIFLDGGKDALKEPKFTPSKAVHKVVFKYQTKSVLHIYEEIEGKLKYKGNIDVKLGKEYSNLFSLKSSYKLEGLYLDGAKHEHKIVDHRAEFKFIPRSAEHKLVFKYVKEAPAKEYSVKIGALVNGNLADRTEILKAAENATLDLSSALTKMSGLSYDDYKFDKFLLVLEKDAYGNILKSEDFKLEEIKNIDRDYDIVANYVSKTVNVKILVFKDGKLVENYNKMEEHNKNSNYEVKEGEGILKYLREDEAVKTQLKLDGFKLDKAEALIGIPPAKDAEARDGKFFSLMDEKGYTLNLYFVSANGTGGTGSNNPGNTGNNNSGNTGNNNSGNTGNNNPGNTGNNNPGNTGNNNSGNTGNNNPGNTGNNNSGNTGNNNPGNTGNTGGGTTGNNSSSNTGSARDSYSSYDGPQVAPNTANNDEVTIEEDTTPLGALNHHDYFAYIQGYPDGTVRSNNYVNREETAAIFFRLLDPQYKESIRSTDNQFTDITKETWSNKHISTLANGGIIRGYEDGSFRPRAAITRGELAVIAAKFDKLEGTNDHDFKDVKGHWAEKYIANASAKGWIKGYPNGEFRPDSAITRAEFATFVNKVLGRNVKKTEVLPGVKTFTDLTSNAWYYEAMVTATNSYLADQGEDGYQKWTELVKVMVEM